MNERYFQRSWWWDREPRLDVLEQIYTETHDGIRMVRNDNDNNTSKAFLICIDLGFRYALSVYFSLAASTVYTTISKDNPSACSSSSAWIAFHRTRSPPPPDEQYGWKKAIFFLQDISCDLRSLRKYNRKAVTNTSRLNNEKHKPVAMPLAIFDIQFMMTD